MVGIFIKEIAKKAAKEAAIAAAKKAAIVAAKKAAKKAAEKAVNKSVSGNTRKAAGKDMSDLNQPAMGKATDLTADSGIRSSKIAAKKADDYDKALSSKEKDIKKYEDKRDSLIGKDKLRFINKNLQRVKNLRASSLDMKKRKGPKVNRKHGGQVRGVGKALRGHGRATYSKKPY